MQNTKFYPRHLCQARSSYIISRNVHSGSRSRSRSILKIFNMVFIFDQQNTRYTLLEKNYTIKEILTIANSINESFTIHNQKGFVH